MKLRGTQTDIAILALDSHAISSDQYALPLAPPYQAKEGQHVLVIGNPEGLYGTVSDGMISAIRSDPPRLQITAPISPGSSGSPVLNDDGEVLGVVKGYDSEGQNLNFASRSEDIVRAAMAGPPSALEQYRSDIHNFSKQLRQPQPTPAVPDRDADAEVYNEVVTLIDNYMRHTQNGKPISLAPYCTTVLTVWYGEKNLSIAQAERSIADYYRKWPVQYTWYDIKQISVSHWSEPDWYDVELPFSWSASTRERLKAGSLGSVH
jgi:Trypsin-like peptidase domain